MMNIENLANPIFAQDERLSLREKMRRRHSARRKATRAKINARARELAIFTSMKKPAGKLRSHQESLAGWYRYPNIFMASRANKRRMDAADYAMTDI